MILGKIEDWHKVEGRRSTSSTKAWTVYLLSQNFDVHFNSLILDLFLLLTWFDLAPLVTTVQTFDPSLPTKSPVV